MKHSILLSTVFAFAVSLSITHATSAHAMGQSPSAGSDLSQVEEYALNLGVLYAKNNPRYAPILAALNIESGADVKKILHGDLNGNNFDSVVAYLVANYGKQDPGVQEKLNGVGLNNYEDIQKFLQTPGSSLTLNFLLQLAIDYAHKNPEYATWLDALAISTPDDLLKILNGKFPKDNLQDQMIAIGKAYNVSPEKADAAAAKLFPQLETGAFQGLPLADIAEITKP